MVLLGCQLLEEPGRVSLTALEASLRILENPAPAATNYIVDLLTLYLVELGLKGESDLWTVLLPLMADLGIGELHPSVFCICHSNQLDGKRRKITCKESNVKHNHVKWTQAVEHVSQEIHYDKSSQFENS